MPILQRLAFPLAMSLCLLLAGAPASGDYIFSNYGYIERFSDSGEYLGRYAKVLRFYNPDTGELENELSTVGIDEAVGNFTYGADGRVYALGNSLGYLTVRRFDPVTGETPSYSDFCGDCLQSQVFPDHYGDDLIAQVPYGRSGAIMQTPYADQSGNLWGIGRIQQRGLEFDPTPTNPYPDVQLDVGWGLHRYLLDGGPLDSRLSQDDYLAGESPPIEVVLQLGPPGSDPYSIPWSVTSTPGGRVFVSTEHGLIDVGLATTPNLVSPTDWEYAILRSGIGGGDPFDASNPSSPYHAAQPWMHPLLAGDLAGDWTATQEGLLQTVTGDLYGPGPFAIQSYDLENRDLLDPVALSLGDGHSLYSAFFRPDGQLMVVSSTADGFALRAFDPTTGLAEQTIFDIVSDDVLGPGLRTLTTGLYVPVPEPSSLALTALTSALVTARRRGANLAVR